MKLTIEELYDKIDKSLLLLTGHLEDDHIVPIIRMCRLKPYVLWNEKGWDARVYRQWIDEYGNSLYVGRDKKLVIKLNDITLQRDRIRCSDLYDGLSIDKVMRISKLVGVANIKRELVGFLGIDGYLRCFVDGEQCSGLLFGLPRLRRFAKNKDMLGYTSSKDGWFASLPMNESNEKAGWLKMIGDTNGC